MHRERGDVTRAANSDQASVLSTTANGSFYPRTFWHARHGSAGAISPATGARARHGLPQPDHKAPTWWRGGDSIAYDRAPAFCSLPNSAVSSHHCTIDEFGWGRRLGRTFIACGSNEASYAFGLRQWLADRYDWRPSDIIIGTDPAASADLELALLAEAAQAQVFVFVASPASLDVSSICYRALQVSSGDIIAVAVGGLAADDPGLIAALPARARARRTVQIDQSPKMPIASTLRQDESPMSVAFRTGELDSIAELLVELGVAPDDQKRSSTDHQLRRQGASPFERQGPVGRSGCVAIAPSPSRPTVESTVAQFHACIATLTTIRDCSAAFLKALEHFGIVTFACGEIDTSAKQRTVFFAIEWPERWRTFYLQSGLVSRDPIIDALLLYEGAFTWSELARDRLLAQVGREALDRARDHGWSDGVVVPIRRGATRFGLVSLVAEEPTIIATSDKSLIALLSVSFHERVRTLAPSQGFPVPPAGLTAREVQCLALIARGKTDREIGAKLGIALSTAHEHVENLKRKLDVSGRTEAVAVAMSLGIIAP